jgi:hypothetical protein
VNVTIPVGAVVPLACVTVAVNVTFVPTVAELVEALSVVVVPTVAAFTVTVTALDVLVLKFASPPYTAVTLCVPAASGVVVV